MNPPAEELPERALSFGVQAYGLRLWSELFTPRQLLMLETFADSASLVTRWVIEDGGDAEYAQAIAATLALCVGKLAQFSTELAVLDFRSS
jgi:putative DNA methylase